MDSNCSLNRSIGPQTLMTATGPSASKTGAATEAASAWRSPKDTAYPRFAMTASSLVSFATSVTVLAVSGASATRAR